MQEMARIAFVADPRPEAAIEVRVNFGIFAGREVTPAEIDELARVLLPEVSAVSIVSEQRHEIDAGVEVSMHQLRIEVAPNALPEDTDVATLGTRLAVLAEHWAEGCISERHAEIAEG
ncbi:MAG: hypothetical protein MSC30_03480 [Gaiellaceae bacterium MAG52_C11]|nr:hypothetical protein [Candidatus Gaiellasilicea maunaloa]